MVAVKIGSFLRDIGVRCGSGAEFERFLCTNSANRQAILKVALLIWESFGEKITLCHKKERINGR